MIEAWPTDERRIVIQPGRPDTEPHAYEEPRVFVLNDFDGSIIERGRKIKLRGTWTLRQYRRRTPCGAQYALHPGNDATYEWEVQ